MNWIAVLMIGLILGVLGGGGGILTVPVLVGLFGFTATSATGASLLVVGCVSLVGAVQGILAKKCQITEGLLVALPSMMGAIAARSLVVPHIPAKVLGLSKDNFLLLVFAILMVYIGAQFFRESKPPEATEKKRPVYLVPVLGFLIGLVSGVLGAGGGFLILPLLTLVLGMELESAIPTSLLVISIQSLGGFLPEAFKPVNWALLGAIVGVALFGMVAGLSVRERIPKQNLRIGFGVLVLSVASWLLLRVLMNHFSLSLSL